MYTIIYVYYHVRTPKSEILVIDIPLPAEGIRRSGFAKNLDLQSCGHTCLWEHSPNGKKIPKMQPDKLDEGRGGVWGRER